MVEKLSPPARYCAPTTEPPPAWVAADFCTHVPSSNALEVDGVYCHSSEVEEHEPANTEISPISEMVETKALEPSLGKGKLEVTVSKDRFEVDIADDMLRDTS